MSGDEEIRIDNGCIKELLQGVDDVNIGNVDPGTIIVYGEHARPVLTTDNPWEVIIAAAVYGHGRIVICSHGSFCTDFIKPKKSKTFMENIKQWLLNGKECDETEREILDSLETFPVDKKRLLWKDCNDKDEKFLEELDEFISNGGGLFIGHCPWGYLKKYPQKTLESMPSYPILQKVGICFTNQHASVPKNKRINIEDNKADKVHLAECIDALIDNESDIELKCLIITSCCDSLPKDAPDSLKIKIKSIISNKLENLKNILPTKAHPLKCVESKATLAMVNNTMRALELSDKAPGISEFPGDFEIPPPMTSADITIEGKNVKDVFSTGYYAPAGQSIMITANCDLDLKNWKIRIGAHSDNLLKHLEKPLKRWPLICIHKPLNSSMEIVSNFGGLIYFVNGGEQSSLSVRLENVVEAPFLDIKDPSTQENWLERRDSPGLWADIVGKYITITVPSSSVRKLDDPGECISQWDEVVCAHYELRGLNAEEVRRQWVVTDMQPSAGYMHSGYPIVTHLDVADPDSEKFLFNMNTLRENGMWGMFHELGHNMQRPMWTFQGTGEVTCNIFSLHAMHVIANKKPWLHKWLEGKIGKAKKYFDDGADFSQWQKAPGLALFIYAQIIHEFGWEPFKIVFRSYDILQRKQKPSSNEEKIDMWIIKMSDAVKHNLVPLFRFWGFPISSHVEETVSSLESFLPDDEVTRLAPERKETFLTDDTVQVGPSREATTCK
ncbi:unnamed protein product [Meganyctiphanes norvegica]|uniref:Peptidase M60 domain-containing protein n=1 Tax=Meganyctiphanes norvegica TaxID=48144 RepID=A0AAV2RRJ1_MEGNR